MNHYTYMVKTPASSGKTMYIGVRSCAAYPEDDPYMGSCKPLKLWVVKNPGAYEKLVLASWPTREAALRHEIYLHELFDVARNPECWNTAKATSTFFDVTGMKRPQEFRDKVSRRMSARVVSETTKKRISAAIKGRTPPNKGVPMTESAKAKLSASKTGKPGANKGRPVPAEVREKISAAKLKNPTRYWLGKTRSEDDRRKMGEAKKGKPLSEQTKRLLSEKLTSYVYPVVECPHCSKRGGLTAMKRWHFDACKHKELAA
jgi:hypothetical protein